MSTLDISRWQFGIVTIYHFFFVPITLALSFVVAAMQTAYYRTHDVKYKRMTKFWGKLFLINFAMGVVTGLVQEFQFGMNWSAYSRFVGDIFGAPLAIEGLLAFFLESTFIGLWIFGWDRLPPRLHLASIWAVAIGTWLSAYFILAANSWMQHPVGFRINEARGRAELTSIWSVLTNSTALVTFPHTITAAMVTAGAFMIGISAWHLKRRSEVPIFRTSLIVAMWVTLVGGVGTAVTGDIQAKIMTAQQPMKMAAAEALYDTAKPASFSVFTIGSLNGREEVYSVRVPKLLSFLATADVNGEVEGINNIQRDYEQRYGPGDYRPIIPVTYWGFRLMIGFGLLATLLAAVGLLLFWRGRTPRSRWFWRAALWMIPAPLLANSFGWIFTEMGRQPWVVFGNMRTAHAVSASVSPGLALTSVIVLTAIYGALAVVEVGLLVRYTKAGPPSEDEEGLEAEAEGERPLAFAY